MFDFAWSELALIAVVALVFIPPKDLPRAMRTVGFWVRKARSIAHEFQGSLEQMVRDAELDEVRQQINKATSFNFDEEIAKTVDPKGELQSALNDPVLTNPLADAPAPALAPPAASEPEAASTPAGAPPHEDASAAPPAPAPHPPG